MSVRTPEQNNALHLYFRRVSQAMTDAGYTDMRKILREDVEIPPTEYMVKVLMWKPVAEAMLGKRDTHKLGKLDVRPVYEVFSHHLANRFGIDVPFPSEDNHEQN